ncbi:MAG: Fic family protein [Ruminococcus sp.]|jgi:Fic family protein|nr:Fic family protein [Ruminococcus sp.]
MSYVSFLQLFYEGKKEEYKKRLENAKNDSCYYELPIKIGKYQAFFFRLPIIYDMIIDIIKTTQQINTRKLNKLNVDLIRGFLIDEIVTTNNIEGVFSSRRDINDVITGTSKNNRIQGLVNRYLMLLSKNELPLESSKDIRAIYDELVAEEVKAVNKNHEPDGEIFRKSKVDVSKAGGRIIHNGVNPESEIITAMDTALSFLNNAELNMFIKIAVFHYLFGYIHPFYDGNGRVDRFISSYLLCRETNTLLGYRLSYTIDKHKSKYYKAFESVNDFRGKGDVTPFICAFLKIVNDAAHSLVETIDNKRRQLKLLFKIVEEISNNKKEIQFYRVLAVATLFTDDGYVKKEIENSLQMSAPTVTRWLKKIPTEYLVAKTINKQKYYKLNLEKILELDEMD